MAVCVIEILLLAAGAFHIIFLALHCIGKKRLSYFMGLAVMVLLFICHVLASILCMGFETFGTYYLNPLVYLLDVILLAELVISVLGIKKGGDGNEK